MDFKTIFHYDKSKKFKQLYWQVSGARSDSSWSFPSPLLLPANLLTKVSKVLGKWLSLCGAEERIKKFRAQEEIVQCNLFLGVASMGGFI